MSYQPLSTDPNVKTPTGEYPPPTSSSYTNPSSNPSYLDPHRPNPARRTADHESTSLTPHQQELKDRLVAQGRIRPTMSDETVRAVTGGSGQAAGHRGVGAGHGIGGGEGRDGRPPGEEDAAGNKIHHRGMLGKVLHWEGSGSNEGIGRE